MEEDKDAFLLCECERVRRLRRVEVSPASARREAEPREPELERALSLGERVGAAEGVDRGERGEPVRILLDQPGEKIMLALDVVQRLVAVLQGKRQDRALDPGLLLLLEVAVDVEEVAHERRSFRILPGQVRMKVDAHGPVRVSHMGARAAIRCIAA